MMYPLRVCLASEMKALDTLAEKHFQIEGLILMENAGLNAAKIILEKLPTLLREQEILVFAGKGNNAGDAFVVARHLLCCGKKVRVFYLQNEALYRGAAAHNFAILKKMEAKLSHLESIAELQEFFQASTKPCAVVDGILGIGLHSELEGLFYELIELLNAQSQAYKIALDLPTGVHADSGAIQGVALAADLTVSFGFPKLGHFLRPGATSRGELVNVGISLPPHLASEGRQFLLTPEFIQTLLTPRDRFGHKNSFGHCLLIGGSAGQLGSITMAAQSCHKMGTGLVTVATGADHFEALTHRLPLEAMALTLESLQGALSHPPQTASSPARVKRPEAQAAQKDPYHAYSSIVIGPGLSHAEQSQAVHGALEDLLSRSSQPLLLDAGALRALSHPGLLSRLRHHAAPKVLTPHPGEMAHLLGVEQQQILDQPLESTRSTAERTQAVVLLKGATTFIASPQGIVYLHHCPNDGLATAGSGDVLSGMIGGLLAQGQQALEATLLGVFLHSLAGELATQKWGSRCMTATQLIEKIPEAFYELTRNPPSRPEAACRQWLR